MNEEIKQALEAQSKAFDEKLSNAMQEIAGKIEALSAKPEEKTEAEKVEAPAQDFGAMGEAVAKAIADGFAGIKAEFSAKAEAPAVAPKVEEPKRKTEQDFSSVANPNHAENKKTLQELSAEIDADANLTPAEKWAKQMELWQSRDAE